MTKLIFLFICLTSFLRADWDQLFSDEEDPSLFHHVNVITGNLNLCMQDIVIEGAKSLPVFRTYSSAGALEPAELNAVLKKAREGWVLQGGWNFLPHANLLIETAMKPREFRIYIPEPSGNLVSYSYSDKQGDDVLIFKPEKGFGQCAGNLSAKTNISNNVLALHLKKGRAVLSLPNGGSRIYEGGKFHHWGVEDVRKMNKKTMRKCFYLLASEILPSRHRVDYSYDDKDRLVHVAVKNPSGTKTYAWMHVDPIHTHSPIALGLRTSDGRSLRYNTIQFREVDYISGVEGPWHVNESITYIKGRKGIGARIKRMDLGGKNQFEAHYYLPPTKKKEEKWAIDPEKKHFETDKVRSLEAPLGPSGEILSFARFSYRPGLTEARGIDNRLIRYAHDAGHLSSIEYCNDRDEVVSILKFIWEGGRLKAKILLDGQSRAYFSKVFAYDAAGNVRNETLWGSLTGIVPGPFSLNRDGSLANAEHYSKQYDYLPHFNLPIVEEEENGLTYRYEYKSDTDLPTAKFTCDRDKILIREFSFYNEDNLLIAEIIDDGNSSDPNNQSAVTERQIKRYDRDPASGLIQAVAESYLDIPSQTEIPLRKIVYSYSPEKRIIGEAVYDAKGAHRYTIVTDYDALGHVILKTTPQGHENRYIYDTLGNLLTAKEVSSPKKIFHYDPAGRPESIEEIDSLSTIKKTFTKYDAKGNLLWQTDSKGNATEQFYDAFGRCVRTQFPTALDDHESPYTPSATFTYDIQGNLASTSVEGGGTVQTVYNCLRKPVQITQADGTVIRHTYFPSGALANTIHPDGTRTEYSYDIFQQMTSKKVYAADEDLLSSETWHYNAFHLLWYTDPNGLTTHYTYDGAGRKISERAESHLITYSYDSLGFLEKQVEADFAHIQLHNEGGKVIEEWKETSDGKIEDHMWFFYNDEEMKKQANRMTSQGKATDLFFYDREFRLCRHVDPQEHSTQFLYTETETNTLGQRVLEKTTIDPINNETIETYDALNRIVCRKQKDPFGNVVSQENLFYDKAGNKAKRFSTVYDAFVPKSHISVCWTYDLMGRVKSETEGEDKTTYFGYDDRGRVKSRLLPNGVSIDFDYDGIDRLLEMKSSDGTIHYQYFYKTGPEPTLILDLIAGTQLKRDYNLFGQIREEKNSTGLSYRWEYDNWGRCEQFFLPDGSHIAYGYNGGHLAAIQRRDSQGTPLYEHLYLEFDPNGHVQKEQLIHNIASLQITHDLLERPTHQDSALFNQTIFYGPSGLVTETRSSLFGDKTYAHDPLNQLIREGDEEHAFDSLGNPAHCVINEYNQLRQGADYTLDYDLNGNPFKRTDSSGVTTYTYDALGRLITITHPDTKTTRYFYDPLSRLIAEQSEGAKLFYLYDQNQEIGAMNEERNLLQLKVVGLGIQGEIGGTVAIEIEGTPYAPLHDFQGNIIALLSSNQEIVESYQIDAFGKEKCSTPPRNPWRFCSKRSMGTLVYFGQRFYDTTLGRWLTPDPSGFADGPNLYVYVLNSPLSRLDLFGLESDSRFPQEMLRMEIPLYKVMSASIIPTNVSLSCKGFVSGVPVDWVVACGYWRNLNFTPQEIETGMVNIVDHFQELVPQKGRIIALITMQNGIKTSINDVHSNVKSTANMVPEGTLIIALHNRSEGILKDCLRTFREQNGKDTPVVVTTRQFLVAISEMLHKINPDLLFHHTAHSEGGVIGGNAIQGMTEEQKDLLRNQLYLLGLGPAKPIPLEFGRGVTNIYSDRDFITGPFALKYRNDPKYEVKFVPCRSTWKERTAYLADHALLGRTYTGEQFEHIDHLRGKWKFYDGKTR